MTDTRDSTPQAAELCIDSVGKSYGDNLAVRSISAEVAAQKISVIVGPSGCGKSTLLRIISGLDRPTTGQVRFEGVPVDGVPEGLAMVFQDYSRSLFPWMRVRKNVAFPIKHLPPKARAERVMFAIEEVGLLGKESLYPWQMSGGMQQRVAIARALASHPKLLLMDEPFASVDAMTREVLHDELLGIWERDRRTVVFITHSIDEAIVLSDQIFVMSRSPATVVEQIPVDIPRPRRERTVRGLPQFGELREHCWDLLERGGAEEAARS